VEEVEEVEEVGRWKRWRRKWSFDIPLVFQN